MKIAIDASRAFFEKRTGIEEYSFQVIKNLRNWIHEKNEVILYVRKADIERMKLVMFDDKKNKKVDPGFALPKNWKIKELPFFYLWTQIGLSWEMIVNSPDVLFVPAHTIPWIYPLSTIVTVHGLEYEHCPESYSAYSRWFHRYFIKKSCRWAKSIIAVSKNTKNDLEKIYKVPSEKIEVVYNGFEKNQESIRQRGKKNQNVNSKFKNYSSQRFVLFIGRLEKRKNVERIAEAFDILKRKHGYEGKLLLVGKPGWGYSELKEKISKLESSYDIDELGYVSHEEKSELLSKAEVFLFPSLCEGFGIPILEAQSAGVPVVTSNFGPMDEVAGNPDILVDPRRPEQIAELTKKMINEQMFRNEVIERGRENVKRFSWEKCAAKIADCLIKS